MYIWILPLIYKSFDGCPGVQKNRGRVEGAGKVIIMNCKVHSMHSCACIRGGGGEGGGRVFWCNIDLGSKSLELARKKLEL